MVEILGNNLSKAVKDMSVNATMTYMSKDTHLGKVEVWVMPQHELDKLIDIKEEDWKSDWGWYRLCKCIFEGNDLSEYRSVNGNKMLGWFNTDLENDIISAIMDEDMEIKYEEAKAIAQNEILNREYADVFEWASHTNGVSTETNITAFVMSLAIENNMYLSEFLKNYLGE